MRAGGRGSRSCAILLTQEALDLNLLLNGFKPVFEALLRHGGDASFCTVVAARASASTGMLYTFSPVL